MTNALSAVTANGRSASNGTLIQKDPIKQILGSLINSKPSALSASVVAPQASLLSSPAVRLNLSSFAQSSLITSQAATQSASASQAPVNLTFTMGTSQTQGYDQQGGIKQSFASTNQIKITVNLVKGENYTVSSGYSYGTSNGAAPAQFTMTAKNPANLTEATFVSSTQMSGSFTATASGTYTLTLTTSTGTVLAGIDLNLYGKSKLPTNSGDGNVDCLLQGQNSWWHTPGTAPVQGGALINGTLQSLLPGSSSTMLTYGFLSGLPTKATNQDKLGFQSIANADEKAAVKAAFDFVSSITNLTFQQFDASIGKANDAANINFGNNTQTVSDGYAYTPNNSPAIGKTYVYINNNEKSFTPGAYGWDTVFHEIGHALGLKHPGNYNAGTNGNTTGTPPFLQANDNHQYTIMSYNDNDFTRGVNNTSYMLYDIAALQYLYGVKSNSSTATLGKFDFSKATPSSTYLKTLWSNTGTDQIDLSGLSNSSVVDLNAGSFSSINIRSNTSNQNNVAIAYGSRINSVTLSTNASTTDKVVLNNAFATGSFDNINNLSSSDKLSIKTSIFGNLTSANIAIGNKLTAATSASTKLIVDSANGDVYFDADGSGTGSTAKKIAHYTKSGNFNIANTNFEFVA